MPEPEIIERGTLPLFPAQVRLPELLEPPLTDQVTALVDAMGVRFQLLAVDGADIADGIGGQVPVSATKVTFAIVGVFFVIGVIVVLFMLAQS